MNRTAIIVDIDGTLAHMNGRKPYEWSKVGTDIVDETIKSLISLINHKYKIILLSGRDGVCRPETEQWLKVNNVYYDELFMRDVNDNRKDSIIKLELFNNHIKDNYDIQFVLDDRNQVVEMWRSIGLKCFQVAKGDF